MDKTVHAQVEQFVGGVIATSTPLSGGSIAQVHKITLKYGQRFVAKLGESLDCEAWMLQYLKKHSNLPLPEVIHSSDTLLILSFIDGQPSSLTPPGQEDLANTIAELHRIKGLQFGLDRSTLIGPLSQPNRESRSWCDFLAQQRFLPLARETYSLGTLPSRELHKIEQLCSNLDRWIPQDSLPTLIHGDLWGGNILSNKGRVSGFIDPAIYYANPEIELAFMTLFGTVDSYFFDAYKEHHDLPKEFFTERKEIYLLYPLLVHLRLFGTSYLGQIQQILNRFL